MTLKKADPLAKFLPATIAGFVYEQLGLANLPTTARRRCRRSARAVHGQPVRTRTRRWCSSAIPNYYGPKPQWDTIVFKAIPDPQTLLLALRSGEIDGTLSASTSTAGSFKSFATSSRSR